MRAAAVLLLGGVLAVAGCQAMGDVAGVLEDATKGTAVSGVFAGMRGLSEASIVYSPAQEHVIGRAVAAEILARYPEHPDEDLKRYVNLVGHSVLAAPEIRHTFAGYRFVVVKGDEIQAVSAPGGFVFVSEGAVRAARDEDELAAVLAHEIAHVSLKHGLTSIQEATRSRSLKLIAEGIGRTAQEAAAESGDQRDQEIAELTGLFGGAVTDITTDLIEKGYSRESELEADAAAATYLRRSGYSRGGLAGFLDAIAARGGGGSGGWFATHPSPAERKKALAARASLTGDAPGRAVRAERFAAALAGR